jgi:hypothetical protein
MDYVNIGLNGTHYNQNPQIAGMKRFDIARFLFSRDGYFDAASSYLIQNLPSLPMIGYYIIVDTPFRPDTFSFDIYGDTQFWWMLMLYNNIIDIRNLPQLTKINYFSLSDLDNMFSKMVGIMGSGG